MVRRQVARLERNVEARRAVLRGIRALLGGWAGQVWLDPDRYGRSNASYLGVRVPRAEAAAALCQARGIGCRVREYLDCSRLPQFAAYAAECPHSRAAEQEILRLPGYPGMPHRDQERIAEALRAHLDVT
jgi:dTDP-4-amino-4,6-dideoxygalactose transaminase